MKKRYVIFLINGKCSYFSFFCYREIQSKYVAVCVSISTFEGSGDFFFGEGPA